MMADGLQFNFPDIDKLEAKILGLSAKVEKRVIRRATLAGIRVLRDQVKANASSLDDPLTQTSIAKNVGVQYSPKQSRKEKGAVYRVGIRGGARDTGGKRRVKAKGLPGGDTFYWRFLEFGTAKMPAKPFMRPAFTQKGNEAISAAINEALRLFAEEAAKDK